MIPVLFFKSHVPGHMRAGSYVRAYDRHNQPPAPKPAVHHPHANTMGHQVPIKNPHLPSSPATWTDPDAIATFLPGGNVPLELNGVPFSPWHDHPRTPEGWDYVDGVNDDLAEPPFHVPDNRTASSGVIIEEPDGRVWLCAPTNKFGGYRATFPKGGAEDELSLQANAIKEAFEETGLKVEITGFAGDFTRTTSVARMYFAKRVGGTPASMGWESQAIHLAPKKQLYRLLNMAPDHPIAQSIGAGDPPKKLLSVQQSIF